MPEADGDGGAGRAPARLHRRFESTGCGALDPVGVLRLDADAVRHRSSMSWAFADAVAGAPSAALPAYRLSRDVAQHVRGLSALMTDYDWQDPPAGEEQLMDLDTVTRLRRRALAA